MEHDFCFPAIRARFWTKLWVMLHEHILGGSGRKSWVFGVGICPGRGLDVSGRLLRHVSLKHGKTGSVLDETLRDAQEAYIRRNRAGTFGLRGRVSSSGTASWACVLVTRPNHILFWPKLCMMLRERILGGSGGRVSFPEACMLVTRENRLL